MSRCMERPYGRRASAIATVAAVLALAGCSATHVGESWQCPIAQGSECASVAAADPALPERPDGEPARAPGEPLYRPDIATDAVGIGRDERTCGEGCGPLAWLARWLGMEAAASPERSGAGADGRAEEARDPAGAARLPAAGPEGRGTTDGLGDGTPEESRTSVGDAAPVSAAAATDDALREPEALGRIWIAPFVDADGIYREGAWVRAVLAPAAWRRP